MAPSPPSARISENREAWRTSREEILRLLLDEASAGAPAEEARAVRFESNAPPFTAFLPFPRAVEVHSQQLPQKSMPPQAPFVCASSILDWCRAVRFSSSSFAFFRATTAS